MTQSIHRPSEIRTIGDHEKRIRQLEADPGCCANSGFENAVAIRDRSCSWYGLGDGNTDASLVHNFMDGGDGTFTPEIPVTQSGTNLPAGTVGPAVSWPLALDTASFQGGQKDYAAPGGYDGTPSLHIDDELPDDAPWTVNFWMKFGGSAEVNNPCPGAPFVASRGASGIFGQHAASASVAGMYVIGSSAVWACADPTPDLDIFAALSDGSTSVIVNIASFPGDEALDSTWMMITLTWDPDTLLFSVYKDGGLLDAPTFTGTFPVLNNLGIGILDVSTLITTSFATYNGQIDEVGIWCDEALSAGDVATLYNAGDPPPPTALSDIDTGDAECGTVLVADGNGGASAGNPCADEGAFVMPAMGSVDVQDIVEALIAAGLVTQAGT